MMWCGSDEPTIRAGNQDFLLFYVPGGLEELLELGEKPGRGIRGPGKDLDGRQVVLLGCGCLTSFRMPKTPERGMTRRRGNHAAAETVIQDPNQLLQDGVG